MVELKVNGETVQLDVDEDTPLLWAVREQLGLKGTRFGCGIGQCGACTMHINGAATRTCILPAAAMAGAEITTIEGLEFEGGPHPCQTAWIEEQVPQCGWCQSGQIMQAASMLKSNPRPTDADMDMWMTNICRCGTYNRIRKACHRAAGMMPEPAPPPVEEPVEAEDGSPLEAGDATGEVSP